MKKICAIVILIIIALTTPKVFAICNDKELIDAAQKITINFEEDTDYEITVTDSAGKQMKSIVERSYAYILNFTPYNENLLVGAKENLNDTLTTAVYDEYIKKLYIGSSIHYSPKKYTIYIYSNNINSCYGELLRTMEYTVPAFNEFSLSTFCKENPDVKECGMTYDSSGLDEKKIDKLIKTASVKNLPAKERLLNNLAKYWYFILIPILLISIYYSVKIHIYKKKVSKI